MDFDDTDIGPPSEENDSALTFDLGFTVVKRLRKEYEWFE